MHQDILLNELCNIFLPRSSAVLSLGKEGTVTVSASPKKIGISMESGKHTSLSLGGFLKAHA